MREIKFRAWDKKRKTMWEVDCLNWYDEYIWVNESPMSGDKLPIGSTPIMQYTGLKDRNGVEIYEGDIIRVGYEPTDGYPDAEETVYSEEWVQEVRWSCSGVLAIAPPAHDFFGEYNSTTLEWALDSGEYECEVIGNIYENPELLEEV